MPGLDIAESIEISKIYSVSHLLTAKEPLIRQGKGNGRTDRWEKTEAGGDISCHRRDFVP